MADIALVQRYLLGQETLTEAQLRNADLDGDGEVTAMDLAMMKHLMEMLLRQPADLIRDVSRWYLYTGDAEGHIRYDGAGTVHVTTERLGSSCYEMQALYQELSLKAGRTYTLTCGFASDAPGILQACIQEDGGAFETFAHFKSETSPEPVACKVVYRAERDCERARINFNCGFVTGSYHITDIHFTEAAEETS